MDEEYLMKAISKMMMEFSREGKRRDAAQQAVGSVVERVGYFDGSKVQIFLKVYNAEMDLRGVEEAMRLEYFCRVVAEPIFEEIKEIQKTHDSWVSFKEALRESYGYKGPKGRGLYEFHKWVSSRKTHRSAMHAFVEFEYCFAQLSDRDRRLVGLNKVLLFVKSIDRNERMAIGIQLEDDDGANGLIEDWGKVERVCQQHDKRKMGLSSTTKRPTRDVQRRTGCGNTPPPKEESSKREASTKLNIEAFMKEAFENLKVQVEVEEKLQKEQKRKKMVIEEEETSRRMRVNEVAETKAQVRYDGIVEEGAEQDTFSSCKEITKKDETNQSRTANNTPKEEECFRTRIVFETTDDEGASLIKACVKGDEECEVNVVEAVAMRDDIESKMAMHESTTDDHVKTFPTLDLETSAVAPKCQHETGETESDGEAKIEADANNNVEGKMSKDESTVTDGAEVLPTIVHETTAVAPTFQRETGETEGGGKKSKDRNGEEEDGYRRRDPSTLVPETSAVVPESQHKSGEMEGGGEEMRVERRPTQKLFGRDRSRLKLSWPSRRLKQTRRDIRSRLVSMRKRKHNMRKDEPRKFHDQEDGQDEGGTCAMHEGLRARGAKEAMTTGHSIANWERTIWWIGWRRWFGWKEWTSSKWRDKDGASKA